MAGGKLYGGSNMSLLLQNERVPCSSEVLESLWVHTSNPASFQGDLWLLEILTHSVPCILFLHPVTSLIHEVSQFQAFYTPESISHTHTHTDTYIYTYI